MRCFIVVVALFGGSPKPSPPRSIFVNRDLIATVGPAMPETRSEFVGAHAHLSFNNSVSRYVVETPDEVMRRPCVVGQGGD